MALVKVCKFVGVEDDEADVGEATGAGVGFATLEIGLVNLGDGKELFKGVKLTGLFGTDGSVDKRGEACRLWL